MPILTPIAQARAVRMPIRMPIRVPTIPIVGGATTKPGTLVPQPEYAEPPSGSATITVGEQEKPTPWLLYGGIAVGVGVVGYLVYRKVSR